jgi:hypothetical protein
MSEACMRYPGWRVVIACFAMTFFGFAFWVLWTQCLSGGPHDP